MYVRLLGAHQTKAALFQICLEQETKKYIYHSPYTSKGAGKLEMALKHNAYLGEQNEKFHTNIERTVLSLLLSLSSYHFTLEFVRWNS
jgi:hypothetical protein